jgi:hypothetical protein
MLLCSGEAKATATVSGKHWMIQQKHFGPGDKGTYLVADKTYLDTLDSGSKWAELRQFVPGYFVYGVSACNFSTGAGRVYIEYDIDFLEFGPIIQSSVLLSYNPLTDASGLQTTVFVPTTLQPLAGTDNVQWQGDLSALGGEIPAQDIPLPSGITPPAPITTTNSVVLPQGGTILNTDSYFAANITDGPMSKEDLKIHQRRKADVDAYHRALALKLQSQHDDDIKYVCDTHLRLRDLVEFDPNVVRSNPDGPGLQYWDPLHDEWIDCPTPSERRLTLCGYTGTNSPYVAGDLHEQFGVVDILTGAISYVYDFIANSTSAFQLAKSVVMNLAGTVDNRLIHYETYAPSTLAPNKQRTFSSVSLAPSKLKRL